MLCQQERAHAAWQMPPHHPPTTTTTTPPALAYLYVDVGGVLNLRVRVQTVRRSSSPPFIQAAVP